MDTDRIAALLRELRTTPSRRAVGRAAVGIATGSILAPLFAITEGEAKKRRKKKKKHRPPPPLSSAPPPCTAGYLPYCDGCCDSANGEVCEGDLGSGGRCLAGGCPAVGLCTSPFPYNCVNFRSPNDVGCWCTTAIDLPGTFCVEADSTNCGNPCTESSECGAGRVCVEYVEPGCECDPPVPGFCATLCAV